jgi:3-deoxy-D-manno-octulosonic-acid transferase
VAAGLARAAWAVTLWLALPLILARLWWRGRREPTYRLHIGERLGWSATAPVPGRLWVHAVSLGETLAAAPLLQALREQQPGLRILLTHGTATGREAGAKLLHEGDAQAWLPVDTPGAVRRFLRAHRPVAGVLLETEIWPNLLHVAQAEAVPMVLANARLSARSAAKGRRFAILLHPAVASLQAVLAQTEADAQRLRAAGALRVQVMGNLKFDISPRAELLARGRAWRQADAPRAARPVVLAAVTREGEEAALLAAWAGVPVPRPLLLVVPRHPQRFDAVAGLVTEAGFGLQRRSQWADAPPPEAAGADVWLGDSLGEMAMYYTCADVALLGGSFEPLGGQNLIEAAACACPLLMGPHTFNFAQAAEDALAAGAAERCPDLLAAVARAVALAAGGARAERDAMAARAQAFAAAHRGAAERMAAQVLALARLEGR